MKKRLIAVVMAIVLAAGLFTGCSSNKKTTQGITWSLSLSNKQLFRIEKEKCSMAQGKLILANYRNIYTNLYGENIWAQGSQKETYYNDIKKITISQLAKVTCMDLLAQKKGMSLTEEEEKAVSKAAAKYYDSLTKDEIELLGIKEDDITSLYQRYALATKLYDKLTGGVNEEVSDDDARVVDMLQIFVSTKSAADKVAAKLESGSDFKSVANYYNEAGSIEISFGRDDMDEAVVKASFALEPEEVSDCIQTEKGYYFFQCVSKLDREKTDANKEVIVKNRAKEAFDDVYDEFISGLTTEYNKQSWNKLDMDFDQTITTDSFFEIFESYCGELSE